MNLRLANFSWMISGNYQYTPLFDMVTLHKNPLINLYLSGILGIFYKKYKYDAFIEYYKLFNTHDNPEIRKVFELVIRQNTEKVLISERPGTKDLKDYFYRTLTDYYQQHPPKSLSEELEYTYLCKLRNKVPKTTSTVRKIISEIIFQPCETTDELIDLLEYLFKRYLHIKKSNQQKLQKIKQQAKTNTMRPTKIQFRSPQHTVPVLEKDVILSAEFTNPMLSEDDPTQVKEKHLHHSSQNIEKDILYRTMKKVFGQPIFSQAKIAALEKLLCIGIHHGEKLFFTRGNYGTSIEEQYRAQLKISNMQKNKQHYEKNSLIYRRSIAKLKEMIRYEILKDMEDQTYFSTFGTICPERIWRFKKLHDIRIFQKTEKNDYGKIVVDILLDQSASQKERQEEVCAQAYCIAEALSQLEIPTRVTGFCNLYHYSMIRIYRDYEESHIKNESIFEYQASGSNRDGLAYKVIGEWMKQDRSEKRVLIILSDGKPNDIVNLKLIGRSMDFAKDYTGKLAVEDSAKEIFQIKNRDISVLGVFTGDVKDLDTEKRIFGQNFCYISHIERFSEVVGSFLKSVLKN